MRPAASFCPEAIHLSRRQNPKYRAEVEFFDALARQMPEGWHVFYHVGWLNRDSYGALRDGDFKFIENYEDGSIELYNLGIDSSESRNLAGSLGGLAEAYRLKLADWRQAVAAQEN